MVISITCATLLLAHGTQIAAPPDDSQRLQLCVHLQRLAELREPSGRLLVSTKRKRGVTTSCARRIERKPGDDIRKKLPC
jgi:hypothetical protein